MKTRNVTLEKGTLVYLERLQLVVKITDMYYLEDMPMDRGWYADGIVITDNSNSDREDVFLRSIGHEAISHIVLTTKPELVLQRIVINK